MNSVGGRTRFVKHTHTHPGVQTVAGGARGGESGETLRRWSWRGLLRVERGPPVMKEDPGLHSEDTEVQTEGLGRGPCSGGWSGPAGSASQSDRDPWSGAWQSASLSEKITHSPIEAGLEAASGERKGLHPGRKPGCEASEDQLRPLVAPKALKGWWYPAPHLSQHENNPQP